MTGEAAGVEAGLAQLFHATQLRTIRSATARSDILAAIASAALCPVRHFFAFSPISVNANSFVAGSLADPAAVAVGDAARGFARWPGRAEPSAASCGSSQVRLGRQSPVMCLLS